MKFEMEVWTKSATSWVVHNNHRNKLAPAAILEIFETIIWPNMQI